MCVRLYDGLKYLFRYPGNETLQLWIIYIRSLYLTQNRLLLNLC